LSTTAFLNARLADPAGGYDGPGALLVENGLIAQVHRGDEAQLEAVNRVDCRGAVLAPGLIDLRAKSGEPGAEPKETLKSLVRAAAAGGVTSLVVQPDTDPAIDDPAMVDFVFRRARDIGGVRVYPAGAATRGCRGEQLAEIGLMREAGAIYITDADQVIRNSKVLRRVLSYASSFGALVAHRPKDPWLSEGGAVVEGELSGRLGLPGIPDLAERIGLERDLSLVELTGARLLVDQLSSAAAVAVFRRAKAAGLPVTASVSINHLSFNEVDLGDYRTFFRLDPPLRGEEDRQALIEAVADGTLEIIVSAHAPAPAEDKRLPFAEAAPGAVGLETLLPALMSLHHEAGLTLLDVLRPVTVNPARLLGLSGGRLTEGAPADLVLFDPEAPVIVDADRLLSKSKNSPFDGRRLQGRVLLTMVDGRIVHEAPSGRDA
jgi:dihydroorotase